MPFAIPELEGPPTGFSSRKRSIFLHLKRNPDASLALLAGTLKISKVTTLRHLGELEREGLVERFQVTHGIGRPSVCFRLRSRAQGLFPQAYVDMSLAALAYVNEHLGRKAVGEVLAKRSRDVRALESAWNGCAVAPSRGFTRRHAHTGPRPTVVSGLLTGFHDPRTSHHALLRYFLEDSELRESYRHAVAHHYLWHEFGDSHLILPSLV